MNLKSLLFPAIVLFIIVVVLAFFGIIKNAVSQSLPDLSNTVSSSIPPSSKPSGSTTNSRCIVTINGSQYDVTELRFTHRGGDVFACGTDMTAMFEQQHGTNFGMIAQFKVQN